MGAVYKYTIDNKLKKIKEKIKSNTNPFLNGFNALLKIHGTRWTYNGVSFLAVEQSGAYAAYNFVDGNTAVRILRYRISDLPSLPKKGDVVISVDGHSAFIQRSKRVDSIFGKLEIDEV